MPLTNDGKNLILIVFKEQAKTIVIGATPSTTHSTVNITWGTVASGALNISQTYTDVIGLRYPASSAVNVLEFRNSANATILTMSIDDFPINPTTNGIYGIISMPVSIT